MTKPANKPEAIVYYLSGLVERPVGKRYNAYPGHKAHPVCNYAWKNGYSENPEGPARFTMAEARAQAKLEGKVAKFDLTSSTCYTVTWGWRF